MLLPCPRKSASLCETCWLRGPYMKGCLRWEGNMRSVTIMLSLSQKDHLLPLQTPCEQHAHPKMPEPIDETDCRKAQRHPPCYTLLTDTQRALTDRPALWQAETAPLKTSNVTSICHSSYSRSLVPCMWRLTWRAARLHRPLARCKLVGVCAGTRAPGLSFAVELAAIGCF